MGSPNERELHTGMEAALADWAARNGGLERLVSVAFSAGKHAEVGYVDWLDNLLAQRYRRLRAAEYQKRTADRRAARIEATTTEGSK